MVNQTLEAKPTCEMTPEYSQPLPPVEMARRSYTYAYYGHREGRWARAPPRTTSTTTAHRTPPKDLPQQEEAPHEEANACCLAGRCCHCDAMCLASPPVCDRAAACRRLRAADGPILGSSNAPWRVLVACAVRECVRLCAYVNLWLSTVI